MILQILLLNLTKNKEVDSNLFSYKLLTGSIGGLQMWERIKVVDILYDSIFSSSANRSL